MIYIEVQRDTELNNGIVRLIRTVPHEVGHQFGLKGDDANNAFGIMSYGDDLQFVPEHLNILRWRISSPGKP
jgi:predicted Zn-dependent protease